MKYIGMGLNKVAEPQQPSSMVMPQPKPNPSSSSSPSPPPSPPLPLLLVDADAEPALLVGDRLRALLASLHSKLTATVLPRLLSSLNAPDIQIKEYMAAQAWPMVRDSIQVLLRRRQWLYVSFERFLGELKELAHQLLTDLIREQGADPHRWVVFVVDEVAKSSMWVFALIMLLAPPEAMRLLAMKRIALAVDTASGGGIVRAFHSLCAPPFNVRRATLVFADDAAYSGQQLSFMYHTATALWHKTVSAAASASAKEDAKNKSKKSGSGSRSGTKSPVVLQMQMQMRAVVAVPFIAQPAMRMFNGADVMMRQQVPGLLTRRSVVGLLCADLFLVRSRRGMFTEYHSLYFDVLGVRPTNTLLVFQHKIADSLSIPHKWLHVGPCVPPDTRVMYRLRPDKAQSIVDLVRRDLSEQLADTAHMEGSAMQLRIITRRICQLMHSDDFRARFMERFKLPPAPLGAVRFMPLLPPQFCSPRYRQFVEQHMRDGDLRDLYNSLPDCRQPPYKRHSYVRRAGSIEW